MPVLTTLEFFRTKQNVESFDKKYPKSIFGLREAILGSLETIDQMLTELNLQYLGGHRSHEAYIREKIISIHLLLNETSMDGIYKKGDFETICDRAAIPSLNDHINKLKEISINVSNYNPNSFTPIVEIFEKVMSCMEKYFLSFYNGSIHTCPSIYLKSPFTYESYKKEIIHDVKEKLRYIYNLSNSFHMQGISIDEMSDNSKNLARKTKCVEMPFFLIFYESADIITQCKMLLLQWIEADKEYVKTLKVDITNFTEEEKELELQRRTDYDQCIKTKHQLEMIQLEHNELNVLKPIMLKKRQNCENKHYEILINIKSNEMVIERAEHRIKDLNKKLETAENNLEIISEINEQKYKIEKTSKILNENLIKLKRLEDKIEWYKSFSKKFSDKTQQLDKVIVKFKKLNLVVEEKDEKLKQLKDFVNQLHKMFVLKSSNETLKKIFYNLQLGNRLSYLSKGNNSEEIVEKDDLSNAIIIISKIIDKDWINLYFNLPFHPPRGKTEIENDISKFTLSQVRGLHQDMALQSLKTWRRLHIRANFTSLMNALEKIKRFDIIKKFSIIPKESPEMTIRREHEDKLPPMSATSRFLVKHYPNLQSNHAQIT